MAIMLIGCFSRLVCRNKSKLLISCFSKGGKILQVLMLGADILACCLTGLSFYSSFDFFLISDATMNLGSLCK